MKTSFKMILSMALVISLFSTPGSAGILRFCSGILATLGMAPDNIKASSREKVAVEKNVRDQQIAALSSEALTKAIQKMMARDYRLEVRMDTPLLIAQYRKRGRVIYADGDDFGRLGIRVVVTLERTEKFIGRLIETKRITESMDKDTFLLTDGTKQVVYTDSNHIMFSHQL